ncbi:hypothetical protein N7478_000003 [Penicillium angulare]|uniref:uncharacterized protein n=1 Tax=Penicillium angulare TaxID=116970 RepID=UPI002541B13B|nr:uncharacterized protein N7478_000003 [Penicillium angulare]KAJ5290752.1 hypothetical protein N7478_000003 [Penicillium angulare]
MARVIGGDVWENTRTNFGVDPVSTNQQFGFFLSSIRELEDNIITVAIFMYKLEQAHSQQTII